MWAVVKEATFPKWRTLQFVRVPAQTPVACDWPMRVVVLLILSACSFIDELVSFANLDSAQKSRSQMKGSK